MGILSTLGESVGSDPSGPASIIKRLMESEMRSNVEDAISYAKDWQPTLDNGESFESEMEARTAYMQGTMWGDMADIIADRFPQTHDKIEAQQLNLSLFKRMVEAKARAFYGKGTRLYLEGENGEELPAEDKNQQAFQAMIEKGRILTALKDADKYTQALSRCVLKLWWDPRAKEVSATVWPQHKVYWVPDSTYYWSPDDCPAVLFELPGRNGLGATDKRYEVWAKALEGSTWRTIHFRTGKEEVTTKDKNGEKTEWRWYEERINDEDTFPFTDEETGEPVYPFVLWSSDTQMTIYNIGSEDALTVPRQINAAFTDLNHSLHYNANPISQWVPTRPDVNSTPPAQIVVGPGQLIQGGDWKIEFAYPQYDANMIQQVWSNITDMAIQMDIGTSSGVIKEEGSVESGLALAIKRQPLYEYRQDMIEIYRPHVIETLKRAIMVHNTYSEDKIIGVPCWEPGDVVDTQDKDAEAKMWILKIEKNLATPVDWLMAETGMDREQAEERIKQNVEENRTLREDSQITPPMIPGTPFGDKRQPPAPFGNKPPAKEEKKPEVDE